MQLGMIGLGKMGGNMVRRLMKGGHECVVYDRDAKNVDKLAAEGASAAISLSDFVFKLRPPRAAWVVVPAALPPKRPCGAGDRDARRRHHHRRRQLYYKDDVRRAQALRPKGVRYVDAGTSGGVWGLDRGYCLMLGGEKEVILHLDPIWKTLAPGRGDVPRTPGREKMGGTSETGYLYCGPSGAGHFVKMIHNGIEYGLMQAYAGGSTSTNAGQVAARHALRPSLADIAELAKGSVV
jgi:6-phosphogluconate dehydrogenase